MRLIIDSDEWYSPYDILKMVSVGLGSKRWFDPATCEAAVSTTSREFDVIWDKNFDALTSDYSLWDKEPLYMNPAYSKESGGAGAFVSRLVHRTAPTMVLLNTALSTNWQYNCLKDWHYIGIINPRVKFDRVKGDYKTGLFHRIKGDSPRYDNIFLGKNLVNFPTSSGRYKVTWLEVSGQ